jgi:hypothetical protein
VVRSSATRSSIEQRDVEEILKSDLHVLEPAEAEDGEPEATPSDDRAGRPGAIHDLSQLSSLWPVAARTSAEY